MKKHTLGAFLLGLAAVGVLGTTTAFADDTPAGKTTTNPTTADLDNNTQNSAKTNGTINFGAGTLSLYNVPDAASFNDSTGTLKVSDVFTKGYNKSVPLSATVADFLGEANDMWTLSLTQGGWMDSSNKPNEALNTGDLTVTPDSSTTPDGGTPATPADLKAGAVTFATGSAGEKDVKGSIDLNLKIGTLVQKGSYSNTLTWNLTDPAVPTQN